MKEADADMKATNQWLKSSGLKAETEGLMMAAQTKPFPQMRTIITPLKMTQMLNAAYATNMRKLLTMLFRVV